MNPIISAFVISLALLGSHALFSIIFNVPGIIL
jgi:hypothetical protein